MPARYPTVWLMTDNRMGEGLWRALRRLPPGSGVVFRHYSLSPAERTRLFVVVRRRAKARRQLVLSAKGLLPGADGMHGAGRGQGFRTWPAHNRREALAGIRSGAGALFVSPVFPTHSHPAAKALGPARAARIGRGLDAKIMALGGMNAQNWRKLRGRGFDGWAAINAWVE